MKVSYLGPETTFTNMAAVKHFGEKATFSAEKTIGDIFESVEKGLSEYGVVPAENSTDGTIRPTFDSLFDSKVVIVAELVLPISQCLMSNSPKSDIKEILSHPQGFAQCKNYLRKNFPEAQLVETSSTANAAEEAAKQKGVAAIASSLASKRFKVKMIEENINDEKHNQTRFFVIGKNTPKPTGKDKTSIVFATKNIPGALLSAITIFANNEINLAKIESRPSRKKIWEVVFFVDFEAHCEEAKTKKALKELEDICDFVKVLGSYPERMNLNA